jgi:MFS family permease
MEIVRVRTICLSLAFWQVIHPAMNSSTTKSFTVTHWLIVIVASIGFLFDTYELLMTPLVAPGAIAELLKVPQNNPLVTAWVGKLLWMTALCGGVFGLLGGWLTDKLGRKTVMVAAIFVYSFSPVAAAFSKSLEMFIFFRCTTFIGVCVEFVAAITWLAEVFEDKKQKERWLGITQAFASLGGVCVTAMSAWLLAHAATLPAFGLPAGLGGAAPSQWRYLLLTGMLPAIPIALLLPFVPESRIWKERRAAGTLKRPSFGALFAPELRRVTVLTAALSACAYGIAFGALQVTVSRVTPGLPELSAQAKQLAPLRKEAEALNKQLLELIARNAPPAEQKPVRDLIRENFLKQQPINKEVQAVANRVQWFQEMGGLAGRIALALLLIVGIARRSLLRIFQFPAVVVLPVTYFVLFHKGGDTFLWAYAACGFLTIAQFSYFGEYLPKVFPLHLRGTGGSFATNVGGRMVGTSASMLTTLVIAPMLAGGVEAVRPMHIAQAAGWVAAGIAVLALVLGFFLPEPKVVEEKEPERVSRINA